MFFTSHPRIAKILGSRSTKINYSTVVDQEDQQDIEPKMKAPTLYKRAKAANIVKRFSHIHPTKKTRQLAKAQHNIQDLEQQQDSAVAHIADLEQQKSASTAHTHELEQQQVASAAHILQLEQQKAASAVHISKLEKMESGHHQVVDSFETLSKEYDVVSTALDKVCLQATELEEACHIRTSEVLVLKDENDKLQQAVGECTHQVLSLTDENATLQQDLDCRMNQVLVLEDDKATLQQDVNRRTNQVLVFEDRNTELQQDLNRRMNQVLVLEDQKFLLRQDVDRCTNQVLLLTDENSKLQQDNTELTKKLLVLEEDNATLQQDVGRRVNQVLVLEDQKSQLQQKAKALQAITKAKDEIIKAVRKEEQATIQKYEELRKATHQLEDIAERQQAELAEVYADEKKAHDALIEQTKDYREQTKFLAEKMEVLKATEADRDEKVAFARAETTNNEELAMDVLNKKDTEIRTLQALLEMAKATVSHPTDVMHMMTHCQQLLTKNNKLEKVNKDMKTDIQNLLASKQGEIGIMNEYLQQAKDLRAEKTEALDQVSELEQKLALAYRYCGKLEKIVDDKAVPDAAINPHCTGSCVPRQIVNSIVLLSTADLNVENEKLRDQLSEQTEKTREIQAQFDECDNELFKEHLAEEARLVKMKRLEDMAYACAHDQAALIKETQLQSAALEAIESNDNASIDAVRLLLEAEIMPLLEEKRSMIDANYALQAHVSSCDDEVKLIRAEAAELRKSSDGINEYYSQFENHFWDVAVAQHDQLHEEIAHWKEKCGVKHWYQARPANLLVHDRRMLQAALRFGREGYERAKMPADYFDKGFIRGFHPAVEMALAKLWPKFHNHFTGEAAWVPLTVPLLTNAGRVVLDDAERERSDARIAEFEAELGELDRAYREDTAKAEAEQKARSDRIRARSNTWGSDETDKTKVPSPVMAPASLAKPEEQAAKDDQGDEDDGMPAFAKTLRARIHRQEIENSYLDDTTTSEDKKQALADIKAQEEAEQAFIRAREKKETKRAVIRARNKKEEEDELAKALGQIDELFREQEEAEEAEQAAIRARDEGLDEMF